MCTKLVNFGIHVFFRFKIFWMGKSFPKSDFIPGYQFFSLGNSELGRLYGSFFNKNIIHETACFTFISTRDISICYRL